MGRPEEPIDANSAMLASFAQDLRRLRRESGRTYREMAVATHYSVSTLAQAADGKRLPSLAVTVAYAHSCGGDAAQ